MWRGLNRHHHVRLVLIVADHPAVGMPEAAVVLMADLAHVVVGQVAVDDGDSSRERGLQEGEATR